MQKFKECVGVFLIVVVVYVGGVVLFGYLIQALEGCAVR